jgi:hypothetical protein
MNLKLMSDYPRVAYYYLNNGQKLIATIWRGTKPGLFSTLVHYPGGLHKEQRYETEAEALAGHRAMVEEESHE